MDPRAARSTEVYLTLHALLWIAMVCCFAELAPTAVGTAPLGTRPLFAIVLVLGTLASCCFASRHPTTASAARNLPSLAAATLLLLAVEGQIAGFHSPRPSPWELGSLAAAACIVATVGGRCLGGPLDPRRRSRTSCYDRRREGRDGAHGVESGAVGRLR